jgi:hypothetical protein
VAKSPGELTGVVEEEAAVGIAVERDPEIGPPRRLRDDELAVLREQWSARGSGVPSNSKKHRTTSIGSRSSTGSIAPAIPFAASITTFSGRIFDTSTNDITRST